VHYGYSLKNQTMRCADGPFLSIVGEPPPDSQRPPGDNGLTDRAVALVRFQGGDTSILSGVARGADQLRNRPAIVDAPVGKGHVLFYVNNPIYRWQTCGEHQLVFNALLFHNDMPPAGELAASPAK
jgi:hypothetical protein